MLLTAKNDEHSDGILVNIFHGFFRVEPVVALDGDGNESALHFKVPGKLFQGNLGVGTHDDIGTRIVNTLACSFALGLPNSLHGETAKLDGLG
jgi:hypothetical protein